jgi:hypothetical protein
MKIGFEPLGILTQNDEQSESLQTVHEQGELHVRRTPHTGAS